MENFKTIVCGILTYESRILIARKNTLKEHGIWEFPGGKLEDNESKEDAMVREIFEELGEEITVEKEFFVYEDPVKRLAFHFFLCDCKNEVKTSKDHDKLLWLSVQELKIFYKSKQEAFFLPDRLALDKLTNSI